MKIKNNEKIVLFGNKIREGKNEDEADYEIAVDEAFQENIKYDFRSLQKEVRVLKKENEELKNRLKKFIVPQVREFKKEITKRLKPNDMSCSVKYLNRIINYIHNNPGQTKSKISEDCIIRNNICSEGVSFLVKNKIIIEKIKKGGISIYEKNNNF